MIEKFTHLFRLINEDCFFLIYRRKQIEEISNNIQEARRIFELLEFETRQLALVNV
jgi:hypothetical protein